MIAPARRAAHAVLLAVSAGRRHLDEALAHERTSLADRRDQALLTELATGTLRWQSRLDYELEPFLRQPPARLDAEVVAALRLGVYQLRHLTRVPAPAVVNDAVSLVRRARKSSAAGLVNAVLRRVAAAPSRSLPERPANPPGALDAWVRHLAIAYAHPEWLVERWIARLGVAATEARLAFDVSPPPVMLRVVDGDVEGAIAALGREGLTASRARHAPAGLEVVEGDAVRSEAVVSGRCVFQDEGSQLVGELSPVAAGARVIDLCAAPGGKTRQYAAKAGRGALVVACDVRARRLTTLAARLGAAGDGRYALVHLDEAAALPFRAVFDVVALDAPCTGLGSLRRNPDLKWRRQPGDPAAAQRLQHDLLARATAVVVPGGAIAYSTCSTEPEENVDVIRAFLARHPDYRIEAPPAAVRPFAVDGLVSLCPERDGLEGYGGAVLRRVVS